MSSIDLLKYDGRVPRYTSYPTAAQFHSGIGPGTARQWLSVLEASYLIHLVRPHHRNFRKRLVKAPKLYFTDVGLAAYLLDITQERQLATHPLRGALFETFVLAEMVKARYHRGLPENFYYWRDKTGNEIDVLIEKGSKLLPLEIKSGQTVSKDAFKGFEYWKKTAGKAAGKAFLVYAGTKDGIHSGVRLLGWRSPVLW